MTGKQRVRCVLNNMRPDRIPIDLHNFLVCAGLTGKPYSEVFQSSELIAESQILGQELFGHDVLLVEVGIATLAAACGCKIDYPVDAAPWIKSAPLAGMSAGEAAQALESLKLPDPQTNIYLKTVIDAVRILAEKKGNELFIMGRADQGPFSLACELRGMDNLMMDLAMNESYVHDLFAFTTNAYLAYARAMMGAGADATSMGESASGQALISPEFYRKFAYPYQKKAIDALHANGYVVANHICGKVDQILPDMVASGADILEIDEKTDIALAAPYAQRGECVLLGTVSPNLLRNAGPSDVEAATMELIDKTNGGRGLILGPGCAMAGDTPVENIKAMINAGKQHDTRCQYQRIHSVRLGRNCTLSPKL